MNSPRSKIQNPKPKMERGFSLLEVILALVILAGAIAVLGECGRRAMKNAERARDMTTAQLLCEEEMSRVVAGIDEPQSVGDSPFDPDDVSQTGWVYSIDVETPSVNNATGLLAVTVTVHQDLPSQKQPFSFSLVRWMVDPLLSASTDITTDGTGGASGASTGNPSNGSSTGSGSNSSSSSSTGSGS
ncbi:MAG: prepilin-type N-terminal cleavage/methylation domain-containing protein [Thermoguttaceae bacterium]